MTSCDNSGPWVCDGGKPNALALHALGQNFLNGGWGNSALTLHTCPPPKNALARWLKSNPSDVDNYGHLLLEQDCDCDDALIADLVGYFESAHADARAFFHEQMGIDLHPDADAEGAHATYPICLPSITRRGLFGEVMVGMLTEHCDYIGGHNWKIPVFCFDTMRMLRPICSRWCVTRSASAKSMAAADRISLR